VGFQRTLSILTGYFSSPPYVESGLGIHDQGFIHQLSIFFKRGKTMPLKQTIKERMISIKNYATIAPDATLREAALSLRKSFSELDGGMQTVVGPRAVLVTDENDKLLGILDFMCFLENYYPQIGGLPKTLMVKDIMLKIEGTIDASASVEEGLKTIVQKKISVLPAYDGDKAVGLIRDTDIFLAITDSLEKGN
jgi:CBS domain-containing protein